MRYRLGEALEQEGRLLEAKDHFRELRDQGRDEAVAQRATYRLGLVALRENDTAAARREGEALAAGGDPARAAGGRAAAGGRERRPRGTTRTARWRSCEPRCATTRTRPARRRRAWRLAGPCSGTATPRPPSASGARSSTAGGSRDPSACAARRGRRRAPAGTGGRGAGGAARRHHAAPGAPQRRCRDPQPRHPRPSRRGPRPTRSRPSSPSRRGIADLADAGPRPPGARGRPATSWAATTRPSGSSASPPARPRRSRRAGSAPAWRRWPRVATPEAEDALQRARFATADVATVGLRTVSSWSRCSAGTATPSASAGPTSSTGSRSHPAVAGGALRTRRGRAGRGTTSARGRRGRSGWSGSTPPSDYGTDALVRLAAAAGTRPDIARQAYRDLLSALHVRADVPDVRLVRARRDGARRRATAAEAQSAAEGFLREVPAGDPRAVRANLILVRALEAQGQGDRALTAIDGFLRQFPKRRGVLRGSSSGAASCSRARGAGTPPSRRSRWPVRADDPAVAAEAEFWLGEALRARGDHEARDQRLPRRHVRVPGVILGGAGASGGGAGLRGSPDGSRGGHRAAEARRAARRRPGARPVGAGLAGAPRVRRPTRPGGSAKPARRRPRSPDRPAVRPASSNASCSARTASSAYLSSITQETAISEVEIMWMLTPSRERARNIRAATPEWLRIPTPTMETLAMRSS